MAGIEELIQSRDTVNMTHNHIRYGGIVPEKVMEGTIIGVQELKNGT